MEQLVSTSVKPIRSSKTVWMTSSLLVVFLNSFMLFAVIPMASSHVRGLYNENRYADGYDQLASNLAAGKGYRFYPDTAQTLMREPGYPILLAGIYVLFGTKFLIVKLLNMVLAFGIAYLITLIAREISTSLFVIFGSPLLFLFHPGTLIAESRGGVEILFAFMLILYMLTVYRAVKSGRSLDYVISGAALGATVLVRSTPILFPLALFAYFVLFDRQGKSLLVLTRNFALTVLAMFVIISPWIIRNYALTQKFVPTASVLGVAAQTGLYLSTHQEIGNAQVDQEAAQERNIIAQELGYPFRHGYYQYFYSAADELSFSQYLFRRVARKYEASPLLFARTVVLNLFKFWCGGKTGKSVAMDAMVQFPFLALAIAGAVLCIKRGLAKTVAPLALLCTYIVGVSVPILAQARYSQPLVPFMSILATLGVLALKQGFDRWARQEGM